MMRRIIPIISCIVLLATGCQTSKNTQKKPSPYERPEIAEVGQKQLELDNMLIEARTYQEVGNIPMAMQMYRKLTATDAECDAAYYGIGALMLSQGMTDSALYYVTKAKEISPENIWYRMKATEILKAMNNVNGLISEWEQLIELKPDVLDYYYELSNAYIMNEDLEEAIAVLNRVEKKYGIVPEISLQKQRLWTAMKRPAKARAEIEALAKAIPQDKRFAAMMAELEMEEERYDQAEYYYNRVLEIDPDDEYAHISLAYLYKKTGRDDMVKDELVRGLTHPNVSAQSKMQLLTMMYTEEEFYESKKDEVSELLDIIIKSSADSNEVAFIMGTILMEQREFERAAHYLKIHLAQDSSDYMIWESLLICLSETTHYDETLNYSLRAAELFPWASVPYYLQGLVHFRQQNYEKALWALTTCQETGYSDGHLEAETHCLFGEVYYALGDTNKFIESYEHSLRVRPNVDWVMNDYAYYLAELGINLDRALELSTQLVQHDPRNIRFQDTHAWVLYHKGEYQEALKSILIAILLDDSENPVLRDHLKAIQAAMPKEQSETHPE